MTAINAVEATAPEYAGPWHNVTAVDITPDGDPDMDLDITVEHFPECDPDDDMFGGCDLGMEVRADGHDRFIITEPGSYRARLAAWLVPIDGYMEWTTTVQIEPMTCPEHRTTKPKGTTS